MVTYEGKTLENIDVLDNDKDPDGDPIRVDSASANNGSATINPDGTIKYKPNLGFNGSDKIVYKITDDKGGSDEANVLINVESEIAAAVKENEDKSQSQFDETVKLIEGEAKKFGCEYIYQKYIVEKKIPISYPPTHNWNEPSKFDIKEYEEIFRMCK